MDFMYFNFSFNLDVIVDPSSRLNGIFYISTFSFFISDFLSLFKVIVEKAPKARIGDLDKKKYLVPSDLTGMHVSDLVQVLL